MVVPSNLDLGQGKNVVVGTAHFGGGGCCPHVVQATHPLEPVAARPLEGARSFACVIAIAIYNLMPEFPSYQGSYDR